MIYNHREINIGQEAKAEAQNTGKSWENGHPEAWDGCGYPRAEVRPRHSRDQQTLSLGQDIAKDVRTPGARPQPWRLRSEVGCGHPPAEEGAPGCGGSRGGGGGREKQTVPSWGQRWAGGIITLPSCHPRLHLCNSSQSLEEGQTPPWHIS